MADQPAFITYAEWIAKYGRPTPEPEAETA